MISSRPSKSFIAGDLAAEPAAALAYEFAFHSSPVLANLDADGENLVILFTNAGVYALFRRALGPLQAWQRFIQWHPSASRETAVVDAREMDVWMFEHRAARAIIDRLGIENRNGRAFVEETGAKLVGEYLHGEYGPEALYVTTGALQ